MIFAKVEQAVVNQDLNAVKAAVSDMAQKAQAAGNEAILKDANDLAKTELIDQARQFRRLSGKWVGSPDFALANINSSAGPRPNR